jgi:hypothetical protein
MAVGIAGRTPHPEEVDAWVAWVDDIENDVQAAAASVEAVAESRKLNPLALASDLVHTGLADALGRLERSLTSIRALLAVVALQAPAGRTETEAGPAARELRRAFAVVLGDLAAGLRSFADLIDAEYGSAGAGRVEEALESTVEIVREARAVVTELVLIDVDPREQTDLWMLQGSVLAAVEHVLRQLDLEHTERRTEAWLSRRAAPLVPQTWQAVRRSRDR